MRGCTDRGAARLRKVAALGLIMLLLFAGCAPKEKEGQQKQEKIKLSFRHVWVQDHNLPMRTIMTDVVKQFEAEHPLIRVDFEGMHQTLHREQRLKSEMVTGNPPDIFVLFGGAEMEPYVRAERLLDLTEFLQVNGLTDSFHDLSMWKVGRGVYGLPVEGFAEPIFYNKKVFRELGLSVPKTWEQLVEVITELKEAGLIPMSLGNQERWPGAMHYHYFLQRYAGSEPIDRIVHGDGSFLQPEYEKATERFLEFVKLKPFPERSDLVSLLDSEQMFLDGEAGMFLNGSWELSLFQTHPEFAEQVGVFNFPRLSEEDKAPGDLASGYTFGVGLSANLEGDRKEAALELLKAIYSPDVQRRVVYETFRLPSMKIEVDEKRTGPVYKQIVDLLAEEKRTFIPYDNILPPALQEPFFQVAEELIDGRVTSVEALQKLEEERKRYAELTGK